MSPQLPFPLMPSKLYLAVLTTLYEYGPSSVSRSGSLIVAVRSIRLLSHLMANALPVDWAIVWKSGLYMGRRNKPSKAISMAMKSSRFHSRLMANIFYLGPATQPCEFGCPLVSRSNFSRVTPAMLTRLPSSPVDNVLHPHSMIEQCESGLSLQHRQEMSMLTPGGSFRLALRGMAN